MNLSNFKLENNIYILSELTNEFGNSYLAVREKEQRILTDKQVLNLPFTQTNNPNAKEWKLRQKSTNRIINYLTNKQTNLQILDIGCGNGWFSNKLANINLSKVIGLDINKTELKQASRLFKKENLQFVYHSIFSESSFFKNKFDIITLNASVQYFPDFEKLITTLDFFLKKNGEIHIIDTPFYKEKELIEAKKRTLNYYRQLGFSKMANYYFHHTFNDCKDFKIMYKPSKSLIKKILKLNDSPFYWLKYKTK